jgi:hypothetical protein
MIEVPGNDANELPLVRAIMVNVQTQDAFANIKISR